MKAELLVGGFSLSLLAHVCAFAQQGASAQNLLLGTWKLVSVTREAIPSGERTHLFGPNPKGYMVYLPDGRRMSLIVRSDRKAPSGPNPTAAEHAALYRSMLSYSGRYSIQGDQQVHDVEISWNETWNNTRQVRPFRIEGKRLIITTLPSKDPVDGTLSTRSVAWEKQD